MEVRLPQDPEAASLARHALESVAGKCVRPEVIEDARLLISEIVTNSVRHADLPQDASINLCLSLSQEKLRAEVCDQGQGFQPESIKRKPEQIGGWGLGIIDEVADRWGVLKSGGVCVWFEIDSPTSKGTIAAPSEPAKI